jgi:predicted amidophosphoribosyltransferase
MTDHTEKQCPQCGQQLRFPQNVGGILMACPTCGNTFHSDFKLGSVGKCTPRSVPATIFEMPNEILKRIGRYFNC